MPNFHIGQKVACIRDDWCSPLPGYLPEHLPHKGGIYHVRAIDFEAGRKWLRFAEIYNVPPPECAGEPRFEAAFFRPIVERETDISIFQRMLVPSRETIDA